MSPSTGPSARSLAARSLAARDRASVWHPFTQHAVWEADRPLVIERAEGMYVYDAEGRRYLDGVSSLWVTTHGHREPAINDAIKAQLDRLDHATFLGLTHEPGIELAELLLESAPPGLAKVFYAGDGSSAVEAAIKMAFQAAAQRGERRPLYVHLAEGYHGDTLGAISVGGIELFHATYRPLLVQTRMISSPGALSPGQTRAECAQEVVAELRSVMAREGADVCAVVVEPMVQAAGGMLTHDGSFLRGVREVCDAHGVSMICDEVATGIGRTGRMWAVDHAGVTPDLLTCGKGLTGGYLPLSAVLTTQAVYDAFLGAPASARTFFHGHTYTANPLCCAAAIANLRLMAERRLVEHAAWAGQRLGELLEPLEAYEGVREVRRMGTMTGVEVEPAGERTGFEVCRRARDHGVWVRPLGDVVILMPPLAIGEAGLGELVSAVDSAVREVVQ
ncbi:MAG: adenosylmethionine--8-amino-7-oxononanoate transaminase [Streptomycetales bacterium]